jgi:hypothetical protein
MTRLLFLMKQASRCRLLIWIQQANVRREIHLQGGFSNASVFERDVHWFLLYTPVLVSDWKHQRISHPVVKQALMREQAGYMIFRHSRSPSLATIVESQLEDDTYHVVKDTEIGLRIDCGGRSPR